MRNDGRRFVSHQGNGWTPPQCAGRGNMVAKNLFVFVLYITKTLFQIFMNNNHKKSILYKTT